MDTNNNNTNNNRGEFSFDDDLFKWTGKGGLKKRIPGKADRVGNILWKLADSNNYIYHFEIEYLVDKIKKKEKISTPIGEEILNRTVKILNEISSIKNRPFTCMIIDAGLLGSIQNMKTLSKNNYFFIISVASNRTGDVFQQFINQNKRKTNFEVGEIKYGQNGQCTAIAWQCKKNKTFYVLTNIPEPILKEKENELKRVSNSKAKKNQYEKKFITTPRVIWLYNNCHNYVDSSKMVINPQRNNQRARTYQRVVFNDCFYILLYNCWVSVNLFLTPNAKPLLFREFLLYICNSQLFSSPPRVSRNSIHCPKLISDRAC
ncbi:hypothetical protein DICPUDRAFT_154718 [Dictyostelium purpureum]|uniref:PiggyBac transposable element-derived protein domain-containing protein n=1 Tax=Dictyostelium purpureum TaxID=5786 RepID=F0ZS31_DICPU|nr:uncharacterized protein DICPUDRAFT_154718 [Dictyostelium purpureum]EGC33232.1 hypothetical protein DICPUDRAFT_154718 [Dictyostelium purpureum]|eukprot:XP_003290225.1 hypothetical protein DICPUDRAFT_154718 [Dictyostelium purpureum]